MKITALAAVVGVIATSAAMGQGISYQANLSGPNESPANASPGIGFAEVDYTNSTHMLHLHVTFSGLTGTTTATHIHAATASPGTGTAGVATVPPAFPGFPLGVSSGVYDGTLDLTQSGSWNGSYVTANGGTTAGAEAAFAAALANDEAYLNIHTTTFGGGEIRGFLVPVPEPSALALIGLGIGTVAWRRRRAA